MVSHDLRRAASGDWLTSGSVELRAHNKKSAVRTGEAATTLPPVGLSSGWGKGQAAKTTR